MILCFISDTHGQHENLKLNLFLEKILGKYPDSVLIHCGDISNRGKDYEVVDFISWYDSLGFKKKILVAGNHDFLFETNPERCNEILDGKTIIYLNDSGVEIDGIKFWGSPVTPWFYDWAFNRRGEIVDHWDLIPSDINILITHGPPKDILDYTFNGHKNVGCPELSIKIGDLKNLIAHSFGHIHESFGTDIIDGVTYINASFLNLSYYPANYPIIFDTEEKKSYIFSDLD